MRGLTTHNLKIVLHNPHIPPNTGCIARTCAATNTELHLIKPIGFDISNSAVKRAGLDYWPFVKLTTHESWAEFMLYKIKNPGRLIAFSPAGTIGFNSFQYQSNDWIVHGREADGLPYDVIAQCDNLLFIPMSNPYVRSLNLSVSAALSLYTAISKLS